MRILSPLLALLLLSGTAAVAQDASSPPTGAPLRIIIPIVGPKCDTPPPTDGVVVVCGRKDGRYRIDPTVLAALRTRDSRGGPRPEAHTTMFDDRCSGVGSSRCPGQNVVPVSSILSVAVMALIKVAKDEDLLPMLHTVPSEYDLYKDAEANAEADQSPAVK